MHIFKHHTWPMCYHSSRAICLTTHCKQNDKAELQIKPVIYAGVEQTPCSLRPPLSHNKIETSLDSVHAVLAQKRYVNVQVLRASSSGYTHIGYMHTGQDVNIHSACIGCCPNASLCQY